VSDVVTATVDGYGIHRVNNTWVYPNGWGGLGTPEVRQVRGPRPREHGAIDSSSLYGPRVMPVRGWCGAAQLSGSAAQAAAVAAYDALKAALSVASSHVVVIRRPGRSADERMVCRLAGGFSEDSRGYGEVIEWACELVAPDPRLYSVAEVTAQRSGAGSFVATVSDSTISTPPILEVVGATNAGALTITNTTTGGAIVLTGMAAQGAGVTLTIDTTGPTPTVTLAGVAKPEYVVAASTDWWKLAPGANTISVSGTALQAGTVTRAKWRTARI
jgi:hypothetical protein